LKESILIIMVLDFGESLIGEVLFDVCGANSFHFFKKINPNDFKVVLVSFQTCILSF
jgi:hypothetical protein